MMTQVIERLTGEALLAKIKELGDVSKQELVFKCGYYRPLEEGEEFPNDLLTEGYKLDFTGFYESLLEAKGIDLENQPPAPKVIGEWTEADISGWWGENRINPVETFGDDWDLVHKHMILKELTLMRAWHGMNADKAKQRGDENTEAGWKRDYDKINDIIERVEGIGYGENDFNYKPYEEKQAADPYLSGISDDSLEVLKHFGGEAPKLLNDYSCAVEDALIEQVKRVKELSERIQQLTGETPYANNEAIIKESVQSLKDEMRKAN